MPNKQVYDINASWDDPSERVKESRLDRRCTADFKIKIALDLPTHKNPLVGPGMIKDISAGGIRCITKHRLSPGQAVKVLIPTDMFSNDGQFPKSFLANGLVKRVDRMDETKSSVAIQLERKLSQSADWGDFVGFLDSISSLHAVS